MQLRKVQLEGLAVTVACSVSWACAAAGVSSNSAVVTIASVDFISFSIFLTANVKNLNYLTQIK